MNGGQTDGRVVGLTGGIAAGKSAVARAFAQLGAAVVDADQIAREVLEPGSEGLAAVADTFGSRFIADDGSLDRKELGALIFQDTEARRRLESITHPAIASLSQRRFEDLAAAGASFIIYEAALLVETGRHRAMDAVVVVTADAAIRRARLMRRDGLDMRAAQQRIDAQLSQAERAAAAHHLIDNSGTVEEMQSATERVWDELRRGRIR